MNKIAYINNTSKNLDMFHDQIMAAIANGGAFGDDLSDLFALSCPKGVWIVDWA